MPHLKPKTLKQLRKEGDIWTCPGCGADNVYSINYVEQVLKPAGLAALLRENRVASLEDLPTPSGSSFDTRCGACHNSFAPKRIGGRRNPILHPAYTHSDD